MFWDASCKNHGYGWGVWITGLSSDLSGDCTRLVSFRHFIRYAGHHRVEPPDFIQDTDVDISSLFVYSVECLRKHQFGYHDNLD